MTIKTTKLINKITLLLLVSTFLLSSCGNKEIEVNKNENSSFYNYNHKIAETNSGYYNLYNGILTFIDKETLKPYIYGNERHDLNTLLNDEDKLMNSEAYFDKASEVFYEDGQIYVSANTYVKQIDEKNNTIKTFENIGYSDSRILYKGAFYYIPFEIEPNKEPENILEKYDTRTGKYEKFFDFARTIADLKMNDLNIGKMFIKDDILYLHLILRNNNSEISALMSINLKNKNVEINTFSDMKDYSLNRFYFQNDNKIEWFAPIDPDDELAWSKKPSLIVENDKTKTKLNPKWAKIFSNNSSIETSFSALSVYKSYKIKDNGLENNDFIIKQDGKELKLDDTDFLYRNSFNIKLSDTKDIILSYEDGNLKIIRNGIKNDIYK